MSLFTIGCFTGVSSDNERLKYSPVWLSTYLQVLRLSIENVSIVIVRRAVYVPTRNYRLPNWELGPWQNPASKLEGILRVSSACAGNQVY